MTKRYDFVILGSGISGLSTAWHILHRHQALLRSAKPGLLAADRTAPPTIAIVDPAQHAGGWIQSVSLANNRHPSPVLFELGARTLRPAGDSGTSTLALIHQLGLHPQIVTTSRSSPSAKNRYIYSNGSVQLVPSTLLSLLGSGLEATKGILWTLIREPFVKTDRVSEDESIHSFVSRRLSPRIADHLVSAIVHGIYAGDCKQLSVRSTLPFLWEAERKHGSITRGMLAPTPQRPPTSSQSEVELPLDAEAIEFVRKMKQCSVYSFKEGMQTLPEAILADLRAHGSVDVLQEPCTGLRLGENEVEIDTASGTIEAGHVVSAIPANRLRKILWPTGARLSDEKASTNSVGSAWIDEMPSVTVAVVNLAYKGRDLLPIQGFGYLIPASEEKAQLLGCVFDSEAVPGQDQDLTRLTVMMGGYRFQQLFGDPDHVDPEQLLQIAKSQVQKHLRTELPESLLLESKVTLQRDCIPQYHLGHHERLCKLKQGLLRDWNGRLSVVGASYLGVSVNDCIFHSRNLAYRLAYKRATGQELSEPCTGLEPIQI
ncbi:uncharacterized protein BJ171DRAFT_535084 [Polychytrium aggregatum]|uniref:uncharacterized protein n=1 Tax=Polychytrium aggregatum TaxID=110093 RepID=UPI0022FED61F|nr:uncharacterized protein BJ171DRAFT_535084 [Polychytrium aggregatum]KAI9193035.1 hypothetical protein BJ171DRAFT_535084 [Polychytrium aggregatum]